MVCRCVLGPAEPDQGWCSAVQLYEIAGGASDGVDLSGTRMAVALQLPGDFFGGIEKARIYFDEPLSEAQRAALQGIFKGERGGPWAGMSAAIGEWLPPRTAKIEVRSEGETVTASVAGVGASQLTWLKTPDGKQAKLVNAPVMAAFEVDTVELADASGSKWNDPDMRPWESLGNGSRVAFTWTG
jgi:hypothetical protein